MDCLFCAIAKGQIPAKKVYEDELCLAFYDIAPQAPVHVLLIPKAHVDSVDGVGEEQAPLCAHLLSAVHKVAAAAGLTNGYRLISNVGEDGCQSVRHLHFHILGGKKLPEQMG